MNDHVQSDFDLLINDSKKCIKMILSAKNKYMLSVIEKRSDPSVAPKLYWYILNLSLNNKKISSIPSISHNSRVRHREDQSIIFFFVAPKDDSQRQK